jgi:uncharacterized protein (TIGR04255 family)
MKSSSETTTRKRIKFTNPPVNELVIALFHIPIGDLKAQHIGIYWDCIRKKYPLCDQQPVVSLPDAQPGTMLMEAPGDVFPLPRFWFHNTTLPTLIQIQRNAFMLNWRRSPALANNEYPHYEAVAKDFWKEFEDYKTFVQDFVGGKLDPIQRCELTYVNLITPNELFSTPAQFVNVLPPVSSFFDIQSDDRELAGLNATVTYRVNPTLLIDLTVRLGRRADTGGLAVGLELKAHGVPGDLSLEGAQAWYDVAHDATYRLFLDATAKAVQEKIWKPQ